MKQSLTHACVGVHSLSKALAVVLGGSFIITLSAQISVPMYPVPMTLQTLAILTIGMTLGLRLGLASVAMWLTQGALGLPVFAGGVSTAAFVGPTAGFLFGFLAMVAIVGAAADHGVRGMFGLSVAGLVASVIIYLPGLAWPAIILSKTVPDLMAGWMVPFIAGDALKSLIAAFAVSAGWRIIRSS